MTRHWQIQNYPTPEIWVGRSSPGLHEYGDSTYALQSVVFVAAQSQTVSETNVASGYGLESVLNIVAMTATVTDETASGYGMESVLNIVPQSRGVTDSSNSSYGLQSVVKV